MLGLFGGLTKKLRGTLVVRIFIVVSLSVVIPTAALFIGALALFENVVRSSFDAELGTALDGAERDLISFLADLTAVSGALADSPEILRAFSPGLSQFDRARIIDRAVDGLFLALPGRDAVRWTFVTDEGLYTSWSRNFNDYSFLANSPLARRARALGGHVAWEGFNPSFVQEERSWSLLASLARLFPTERVGGESLDAPLGILILSAETDAFKKYLGDRRASDKFATLLVARSSGVVVDASNHPIPKEVEARVADVLGAAPSQGTIQRRVGSYLMAGRRLDTLPSELALQEWSLVVLYSFGDLSARFDKLRVLFIPASALLLVASLLVSFFVSRRVVRPVVTLSRSMSSWQPAQGPILADQQAFDRTDEIGVLNRSFLRLQEEVISLVTRVEREHAVRERYRYRSLRAQLNPHFLFNSLNSVRSLALVRRANNIVDAVDQLSGLLAYSMGKSGDFSTLDEELQSVECYLSVQNLRFGGRFHLERLVPAELLRAETLRFMLQPLVENSVIHGYRGASGEGVIEVSASEASGILIISVADRGIGLDPAALESRIADDDGWVEEGGLGLRNVRDMISLTYGEGSDLSICSREGGGAIVRIRLPLRGDVQL